MSGHRRIVTLCCSAPGIAPTVVEPLDCAKPRSRQGATASTPLQTTHRYSRRTTFGRHRLGVRHQPGHISSAEAGSTESTGEAGCVFEGLLEDPDEQDGDGEGEEREGPGLPWCDGERSESFERPTRSEEEPLDAVLLIVGCSVRGWHRAVRLAGPPSTRLRSTRPVVSVTAPSKRAWAFGSVSRPARPRWTSRPATAHRIRGASSPPATRISRRWRPSARRSGHP